MMPEMIVMPQVAKPAPGKAPSAAQAVKTALQKASTQGDNTAQTAPIPPGPKSKLTGDKTADQPVQFMDLLMAQIAQPAEQLQPEALVQGVVSTDMAGQPQQTPLQIVATAIETPQTKAAQVITNQSLISAAANAPVTTEPATLTPAVETPESLAAPQTPTTPVSTQTPVTEQAAESAAEEGTEQPSEQQPRVKSNPIPAAAQTPSLPSLKNGAKVTGAAPEPAAVPEMPASENPNAEVVHTPSVPNKPALAEALAARMAARRAAKSLEDVPSGQAAQSPQSSRAFSLTSAAWLHNPHTVTADVQQTAVVSVPAPAQSSATAQSTVESALSLRMLASQVVEGIRSAAGSDKILTLNLNPPELGRVFVRLEDDGGSINAVLKVESPVTRADIERSVPSIVRSLEQIGVQVRRVDVLPTDPVPQEGSSSRQYDLQGQMSDYRESQSNSPGPAAANEGVVWDESQAASVVTPPVSTVSDSAINLYM